MALGVRFVCVSPNFIGRARARGGSEQGARSAARIRPTFVARVTMLEAQLHGKLARDQERLEDLLTSNVFGSLKYVPPKEGLQLLLNSSVKPDGSTFSLSNPIRKVRYDFWPFLRQLPFEACEPDLIIQINRGDSEEIIVLVEAKYFSGVTISSDDTNLLSNQLAREWINLLELTKPRKTKAVLLFITPGFDYPHDDVRLANEEFRAKYPNLPAPLIVWNSWRRIPSLFTGSKYDILNDVVHVLQRYGLTFFIGISRCTATRWDWSFAPVDQFIWKMDSKVRVLWSISDEPEFYIRKLKVMSYSWSFHNVE